MIEEYQTWLIPWNSLFTESMSLQLHFQAYELKGAAVTQSKRDIKRLTTVLCCTKIPSMCWALARVFLPSRNSWRKSPRHSCLADFSMRTRQWLPSAPPRLDCTTRGRGKRCVHSVWSQGGSDIWTNVRNIFKENAFLLFFLRPFNNARTLVVVYSRRIWGQWRAHPWTFKKPFTFYSTKMHFSNSVRRSKYCILYIIWKVFARRKQHNFLIEKYWII